MGFLDSCSVTPEARIFVRTFALFLTLLLLGITPAFGASLTIGNGVVTKAGPAGQLVVRDTLNAQNAVMTGSGSTPTPGDWPGVVVMGSSAASRFDGTIIEAAGVGIDILGAIPVVQGVEIRDNLTGVRIGGGSSPAIRDANITRNRFGVEIMAGSGASFANSVFANNSTAAINRDPSRGVSAAGNWWGHPSGPRDSSDDTATSGLFNPAGLGNPVSDGIVYAPWATTIPLLGAGLTVAEGTFTDSPVITLNLSCRTCAEFRVSEDPAFSGVLYQPFSPTLPYSLSAADGQKTVYAQFRTSTGNTSSPLSAVIRLDTAGPTLTVTNPPAASQIRRPLAINASAADPAGVAKVEFYIDNLLVSTDTTNSYSYAWDVLAAADGGHELKVIAYDTFGHTTTDIRTVTVSKAPPSSPSITSPAAGTVSTGTVAVAGSAEPGISVSLFSNGTFVARTTANLLGSFQFQGITLGEGANNLTAAAADTMGASPQSAAVLVTVDTGPPGVPRFYSPNAVPGGSIKLSWTPDQGEMPARYKLYRSAAPFTAPAEAVLVSGSITATSYTDIPTADGVYYYGLTAVDTVGNESALSPIVNAASDRTLPTARVEYTPVPPVGPGSVTIRLTLSEPLAEPPYLGIAPAGEVATVVALTKISETEWTGSYPVTGATPHGTATAVFAGKDPTGNKGTQITSGSSLAIDTKGPAGSLRFTPSAALVKPGTVTVALTLDEPAAQAPILKFRAPSGAEADISLAGGGTAWSGVLAITAAMGDGAGLFSMAATDALGNIGSQLTGGAMTLDITPPVAPTGLAAVAASAGKIRLTWGAVADAASYSVYRVPAASVISLPATPLAAGLTTGSYSDTPGTDGSYRYGVTAVDPAGNESILSADALAVSDRLPPGVPSGLSLALAGTLVQLSWNAPAGEAAAGYNLYRSSAPITALAGLTPVKYGIAALAATDIPPGDGTFYYAISALDQAGNEGLPSNEANVLYNLSPPAITVTGVSNGQYGSAPMTPVIAVQSASLATQSILLDGQSFASGTQVSAEGEHLLHIEATDTQVRTTVKEVRFTIDLTDPVVTVANVAEGVLYETAVSPLVTVSDVNLDTTVVTLNGVPYQSGAPIVTDGAKTLRVEAKDLAGRAKVVIVNFTVDVAPPLPASLAVTATQGASAVLGWGSSAASDVAGYFVYKNGIKLNTVPQTALTYTDAGFGGDVLQTYEVSAVDAAGHEGLRLAANVPPVQVVLNNFGRMSRTGFILAKQFLDLIKVDIVNGYGSAVNVASITYELRDQLGQVAEVVQNGPVNLAAGSTLGSEKILPVGNGMVDYRTYNVTLALPADPNVTVRRIASFKLEAFDPGRKIEIFNEPIIKGGTAKIRLKVYNHGSAPIELLTSSGDQPSADIYVLMKDQDGNILAKGNLNQKGVGVINYSGYALAEIEPGGSFLSAPVEFVVPTNVPDAVTIEAYVKKIYYRYNRPEQVVAGDFGGFTTVYLSQPAYRATITSDSLVYDQNTPVILSGRTADTTTGQPVPNATVKIGIGVKGFDRFLLVTTDGSGNFSTTFTPLNGEAGNYTAWATHPAVYDKPVQAGFTIYGMTFDPRGVNLRMSKNASFTMPIAIKNLGEAELSGCQFSVAGGMGITGTVDTTGSATQLVGGKSTTVRLTLTASTNAPDASSATVTVTTSEGIRRTLEVNIALLPALPTISTDPSFIEVGVSRNSSKVVTFKLKNTGYAPLQNIVIQPPALPWIGLVTGTALPDLAPGASTDISVNFRPSDSVAQGSQADKLVITSGNHVPYTLNLFATVSSTGKGSVLIQATDSLNKKVGGASVTIAHQLLGSIVLAGTTDTNGEISFLDITEGLYNYKVQAPGHEVVVGTFAISPEVVTPLNVFMNNVFVTLDWSVTPMSITDKYTIKLEATFETQVPAPVITIEPAYEKLEIEIGSTYVGEYRVKNHGLVALDDVKITPAYAPGLRVETLLTEIPRIGAQETVIIPYRITVNPFKDTPVDPCSSLPMTINVGGTYVCAAGVPSWTWTGATKTITPKDRYDLLGLCDVGCDWCKCVPEKARGLCECIKTRDACACAGLVGGGAATAACNCLGADDPAACAAAAAAEEAEAAVKDAILSLVPPLKAAAEALELGKNIASCLLCVLEALPPLPSSSSVAEPGGGGIWGGGGSPAGGGSGFSSVRICR